MLKYIFLSVISLIPSLAFSMPEKWQMGFQEPASVMMEEYVKFHDQLLIMCFGVSIFVFLLIAYVCVKFYWKNNPVPSKNAHNTMLEIVWTAIPVLILIAMSIPSLRILYKSHEDVASDVTLKIVGMQWFWQYEYPDEKISFESRMIEDKDLQEGQYRLYEVDNRIVVPVNKNIKILVTASDVIHDWAVPAFGIKEDAVPGRTNETWFRVTKEGVYRGQCSELCGDFHGFMPIVIEAVSEDKYKEWLDQAKTKFSSIDDKNSKY